MQKGPGFEPGPSPINRAFSRWNLVFVDTPRRTDRIKPTLEDGFTPPEPAHAGSTISAVCVNRLFTGGGAGRNQLHRARGGNSDLSH